MIFCFSGTGNSRYAAEKLSAALDDDLIDIPDALRKRDLTYHVKENEKVGFVFPVYFFALPTIIEEFVGRLTLEGNPRPYVYVVFTCGGEAALADRVFARLLAKQGRTLSAAFSLPMVDNYILMYDVHTPSQQQAQLAAADQALGGITRAVAAGQDGGFSSGPLQWAMTTFLHPLYRYGRRTRKFHAEDTCNGCGLCEEICPCGAIKRSGVKPQWVKKRCVHCLGCIHRCPEEAIQYGKATKKRHRYVHPILRQRADSRAGGEVDAAAAHGLD